MYSEDELLPLSGLQHMAFCERRWALVEIESVWEDNRFTAEGKALHERAHSGEIETRPGVLVRRTLPVRSLRLGISGQADVVEFQPCERDVAGVALAGRRGRWQPFPIEYKRRRDKAGSTAYQVQLCAQAVCLEEMLSIDVPEGAVYDGSTRRRNVVPFTRELRERVELLATRMHILFRSGETPKPVYMPACQKCSLIDRCFPEPLGQSGSLEKYYRKWITEN